MMIKICYLLDELETGGLEKTVIRLVLNSRGRYAQQIWCLKKKGSLAGEIESQGIEIREFNFAGRMRFSCLLRLIRELKRENFQIIYCHGLYPSIWGISAAIFAGVQVRIQHCHNVYYKTTKKDRIKLRILTHFTTKIITISEAVKKTLVEFVGLSPKKVQVIHNSAPSMELNKDYSRWLRLRQELGIDKDDFVVGNISRLAQRKGHLYLVKAMANEKLRAANCKCLIVGDGPERASLESEVRSLNLQDRVIFTGCRKDIENYLSIMDIFVLPSILYEGLGICLAEAASVGLALIGSDLDGIPEIIQDGINGFLVAPRDADALAEKIQYFLKRPQEKKRMGENAKKIWREEFSLEKMMERIDDVYTVALKKGRRQII